MRKRKNQGFTLVELLCVIVIIGILSVMAIVGVSRLIRKARDNQLVGQEKTIQMAAESYTQNNKDLLPKSIGESKKITLQELKEAKYIKDDILNSSGASCMKESYVRVYKLSKTEYTYTVYLYCGNEKAPDTEVVPNPIISVRFTDESGETTSNVYNNVSKARLVMTLKGSEDGSIALESYNYSISVKTDSSSALKEVYSSGTLSAGKENTLTINKALTDYIDITTVSSVSVKITVRNAVGGLTQITSSSDDANSEVQYNDKIAPTCSSISNQASSNSWINKYSVAKERKITAQCNDGDGSGCIRDTFTRTWPNDKQTSAEYAYIQVVDNAGNKNISDTFLNSTDTVCGTMLTSDGNCRVRVNVDLVAPTIKVTSSNFSGAQTEANDSTGVVNVSSTQYKNLVNGWMNKTKYPDGISFDVTITDNLHLSSWKWETNASYINSKTASNYNKLGVGSGYPDSKSGTISDPDMKKNNCGTRSSTITISLKGEGMRKGKLTVKDKAGNETVYVIAADIDRTAPPNVTTIVTNKWKSNSNNAKGSSYSPGTWSNLFVMAIPASTLKTDNNNTPKANLSGFDYFEYTVTKADNKTETAKKERFDFNASYQGKNKIKFRSCDKAGNCSSYSSDINVWIDTVAPTCTVSSKIGSDTYSGAWTNKNVVVTSVCTDATSGCKSGASGGSHTYSANINTTQAGAAGNKAGGEIQDNAGNKTVCLANKTVKIDKTAPTCTNSGDSTTWTKKSRTIKWGCKDTGGSACNSSFSGGSKAFSSTTKTATIDSYTIKDNAGNSTTCAKRTANVYVDTTKPSCTAQKSNTGTTSGVTATFSCSDGSGSGVKKCPSRVTGLKSSKSYTVTDNVGNSNTCTVKVTSTTQYRSAGRCASAGCQSYSTWLSSGRWYAYGPKSSSIDPSYTGEYRKVSCSYDNNNAWYLCYTYTRTCKTYNQSGSKCGWNSWGSSYCTVSSNKCEKRTLYS